MVILQTCEKGKYQLKSPEYASLLSFPLQFFTLLRQDEFVLHGYYKGCVPFFSFSIVVEVVPSPSSVFKEDVSQTLEA